ncbi:hypothetical protein T11_9511 [Trichinella zimbabwensis]|uniref:Uncharacterized protein n=1 Tax=Trichinella zimbabwensis TaxID=268475 RepID=A0A0V1HRV3_9BILA|nr:hypothetical protein T11_9511 [Trichinella zimbabwensis]
MIVYHRYNVDTDITVEKFIKKGMPTDLPKNISFTSFKGGKEASKKPSCKPLVSTNAMSQSQFCILSPLKSKRAEEEASKLLQIFLTVGSPSNLTTVRNIQMP